MTVARLRAGDKTRLTGRPTDPTGFFTSVGARPMPARVRFAAVVLVVGSQLTLVVGAIELCGLETEYTEILPTVTIGRYNSTESIRGPWNEYRYRGYPVP